MKVEGIWKPAGRMAAYNKDMCIKDGIMQVALINGKKKEEEYALKECNSYKSFVTEAAYIFPANNPNEDIIIHVEEHDGHLITILSNLLMEYDGRGLIVGSEYVHEDDYQFVAADFESKLRHHLNDRNPIPMTSMHAPQPFGVGMMGMMGGTMDMYSMQQTAQMTSEADKASGEDAWTCSCGHVNVRGKFCGECGMKKSI